ncbi:hypothetical protein PPROV_000073700 [Pycnococcus provasolii]|uniref:Uncharacterized protein n=1 Tax=Pycnococcus provasolii TaxID=41880 RepID=A0A830H8K4_9CHLO|nr:hypothetical protein PPROV_000073700 [Pycnococcus provasolii]
MSTSSLSRPAGTREDMFEREALRLFAAARRAAGLDVKLARLATLSERLQRAFTPPRVEQCDVPPPPPPGQPPRVAGATQAPPPHGGSLTPTIQLLPTSSTGTAIAPPEWLEPPAGLDDASSRSPAAGSSRSHGRQRLTELLTDLLRPHVQE